ncbi:MAG TPA: hypothetical protein VMF06_10185 [Candidatus Limnocylindria bacterium]|nr:hypothetical protein [Candidatus Limnocylindria bacterium]
MTNFYTLEEPKSPWGDYSHILIAGMSGHSEEDGELIQLERTGPYVPSISFLGAGGIVVTDAFKKLLEGSGLTGFRFRPVIKKHIVLLNWQDWDQSVDEPPEYPEGGEPEGYILDRPHSPETSDQMGDLWEVCLEVGAEIERLRKPSRILLIASSWRGGDLFRAGDVLSNYVTQKAKRWFERHAGEHVSFKSPLLKV